MRISCFFVLATIFLGRSEAAVEPCGAIRNDAGLFDYRVDKDKLATIESYHFNSDVENLRRGASGSIAADLDYTLRAFPNHPRALLAMMKLAERLKVEQPKGATYSVACYFDRALRFRPDDGMARVLFANYLVKRGNAAEAAAQLKIAQGSADGDANIEYNLGLAYFDLHEYAKSLEHAHRAYQLGFPLPGLRNKLLRVGKWRDPQSGKLNLNENDAGQATADSVRSASTPRSKDEVSPRHD